MPRQSSARVDLGHGWLRGEDWWGDPMSDNMTLVDALLHPFVKTTSLNTPPVASEVGETFIVASGGTGDWVGYDNALAVRYPDRWRFVRPYKGLRARIEDLGAWYWWTGEAWVDESTDGVEPTIGTKFDILCSVGYPPEPLETVLLVVIPEPMTLPKNGVGSLASTLAAPPVGTQAYIYKNGTQIGTVLFPSNAFAGTITVPVETTFAPGDRLHVQMGETVPSSFGNFGITLRLILVG